MITDMSKPDVKFTGAPDAKYDGMPWEVLACDLSLDALIACLSRIRSGDRSEFGIKLTSELALDWLESLKSRLSTAEQTLSAVRLIEFTSACGDSDGNPVAGTETLKYLCFNTKIISESDALGLLNDGRYEFDSRVTVLWPSEAKALFPDMHED